MTKKTFTPTQDQISAANALCLAMAYTETIRPRIEAIQKKTLENGKYKWVFPDCMKRREDGGFTAKYGEYCTDPSMTYLISDADANDYFTHIHYEYIAAGFKIEKFGFCPLLIAEDLERKARRLLVEVMEPVLNFKYDDFFNTTEWESNLKKYIDLTLRLLVPFIPKTQNSKLCHT